MSTLSSSTITIFASLTLVGDILAVILIILLVGKFLLPKNKTIQKINHVISQNYIATILVVSAVATMGSLTFSEVLGFLPCKLCWFQRITMYPLVVLSFIALITNDMKVRKYILPLAVIGFLVSGYHILLQLFPNVLQCSDEVIKCSSKQVAQFGYITIPVMSFTAFLLIILFCLSVFEKRRK